MAHQSERVVIYAKQLHDEQISFKRQPSIILVIFQLVFLQEKPFLKKNSFCHTSYNVFLFQHDYQNR